MELNITRFFFAAPHRDYASSCAELGQEAGRLTWGYAMEDAPDYALLTDDDAVGEFKRYFADFGAWDDEEIAAMDKRHCTALLMQLISGEIREGGLDPAAPDWAAYGAGSEEGVYSGSLFAADDGQIYFYIGC